MQSKRKKFHCKRNEARNSFEIVNCKLGQFECSKPHENYTNINVTQNIKNAFLFIKIYLFTSIQFLLIMCDGFFQNAFQWTVKRQKSNSCARYFDFLKKKNTCTNEYLINGNSCGKFRSTKLEAAVL